ncbi:hypothetical protein L1887_08347 [Cichorium endivia]|nr:hypothetical protein L1887_08347 [Cichorium endivia]
MYFFTNSLRLQLPTVISGYFSGHRLTLQAGIKKLPVSKDVSRAVVAFEVAINKPDGLNDPSWLLASSFNCFRLLVANASITLFKESKRGISCQVRIQTDLADIIQDGAHIF